VGNADAAVADLNRDGLLDLVLTSYHAGHTRSHPSTIRHQPGSGTTSRVKPARMRPSGAALGSGRN